MTTDDERNAVISYPIGAGTVVSRAIECGRGDNVIICLHGAGSRADRWRRNLPGLAASGFHVYAIDFPGHGFAEKHPEGPHETPAYAEVVLDFIDQLGSQRVNVAGTSLGGHVAAWMSCQQPERIRAVAMIGAAGLVPIARDTRNTDRVDDVSLAGVRSKLEFLVYDQELVTDLWVMEESRINTSPGAEPSLTSLRNYLQGGIEKHLVGPEFVSLGIPTILIWGRNDRWIPTEVGFETAKLMPDAPMVVMERAGHAPYFERPETFNRVLIEFFNDPAAVPPGLREV